MRTCAPSLLARHALLTCLVAVWGACGGATHEPGDPLRTAPIDVDAALIVPSVARLQAGAAGFLEGLPGASGVLELIAERFGLDLRTPDGLVAVGLDPSHGAIVWLPAAAPQADGSPIGNVSNAIVIAVPVRDAKAFGAHVDQHIVRGAGGTSSGPPPDAWSDARVYAGPVPPGATDGLPRWRACWGVSDDGIGIVVVSAGGADPVATYKQALAERGGLANEAAGRLAKARATAGADASLYMIARDVLPAAPAELGFVQGMVDKIRVGLRDWQGGVVLSGDRLGLRIASDFTGDGELPVTWVSPTGPSEVLANVLPKTTTALIRFRVNLGKLRALPSFILEQVLPEQIPGLEMLPIPALSDAIQLIEGDIGVAFLGIDPNATFGNLTSLRALRARALETFRVALVARLRDGKAAMRQFGDIAAQLESSDWVVAALDPASAGGWSGWTFVRGTTTYSVLIDANVIVFIVGPGEVDQFIAAKGGRATTLGQYGQGFDATIKEALGLVPAAPPAPGAEPAGGTALGISLGFLRVTRELADKGVPPFFLKMLSRIRLVGLTIDAAPRRVTLGFEVAR